MYEEEIISAINNGNVKSFKKLIVGSAPEDILEEYMLHFVENGEETIDCLKFFIKIYPELLNNQNDEGETLLHYAVKYSYKATSFLLDEGADISIKDSYGRCPLLEFFENYYFEESYDILELLINQGANVKEVDEDGNGPLHHLAVNIKPNHSEDEDTTLDNKVNILEVYENMFNLLVKHGAEPFLKNDEGDTPLFYLIKSEGYEGCDYELSKIFEEWLIKLYLY